MAFVPDDHYVSVLSNKGTQRWPRSILLFNGIDATKTEVNQREILQNTVMH